MRYVSFSYFTLLTVQYVIQYIAAGSSPLLPGPLPGPRSIALQFPQNKKVRINVFQQSHIPEVRTNAFLNVIKMRGGDLQMRIDAFDLGRERIRLEAMSSYGVMTALIMGAALRLYSHVSPPKNSDTKRFDTSSYIIFLISCSICVLSGAYTTLTFSLLSIYSKTALGMANDTAYLQFLEKTSIYRKIGFDTFLVNLLSFLVSFLVSVITKIRVLNYVSKFNQRLMIGAIVCAILIGTLHGGQIVSIAGDIIYSP